MKLPGMHKEVRRVLRQAARKGCTVGYTGSTHLKVSCPNGYTAIVALTPRNGDHTAKNVRRDLRKYGGVEL